MAVPLILGYQHPSGAESRVIRAESSAIKFLLVLIKEHLEVLEQETKSKEEEELEKKLTQILIDQRVELQQMYFCFCKTYNKK